MIGRRVIVDRVPEACATPWWMKLAYYDVCRREAVMVAWPLNYLVQVAWALNLAWSRYRHRPSWIDRRVAMQMEVERLKWVQRGWMP